MCIIMNCRLLYLIGNVTLIGVSELDLYDRIGTKLSLTHFSLYGEAIWRDRYETTLAQVMACCLTAPSHYLNQCWLIIKDHEGVQWQSMTVTRSSHEINFTSAQWTHVDSSEIFHGHFRIMAWCRRGDKPLPDPLMIQRWLRDTRRHDHVTDL